MEPKRLTAERFVDMRTGCSYRYVHSSTEYFRPHDHDYYEIFLPLEGRALHLVNNEQIPLKTGTAVLIRPWDTHDYRCENGESFYMLNITFTAETANAIFSFLGEGFDTAALLSPSLPPVVKLSLTEQGDLEERMSRIRLLDHAEPQQRKAALRSLLLHLMADCFAASAKQTQNAPQWLSELREQLKENGAFIRGSEAILELTDKSREHICRSMKKYYGVTVSEYINDLRLVYITNMLRYSDHKILDIIFESGFNNVSWCCKCFQKKYGMTMSEYRK
ncbi:MAG: AraC family transcriptional regulator [Clostridia bacterium]|nr:AraC family transcriptional regulator [Clostridia bacterium]